MAAADLRIKTAVPPSELKTEPSCRLCVKNGVCVILRALKGLADQFGQTANGASQPPFKPEDFAKICAEFLPVSGMAKPVVEP